MLFMYSNLAVRNPGLEVRGLVLICTKEITATKALHQKMQVFVAFLFIYVIPLRGRLVSSMKERIFFIPMEEKMDDIICKRAATVQFWDIYAKWYRSWIEHNNYHDRIIDVLTTIVEPGWRVLDIGAGNGVLSLPLCAIGCDVTSLEPSAGMRNILYEETFNRGIDWLHVDERRWEDSPVYQLRNYDLIMACNSLHLTEMGFKQAVEKIFHAQPKNVFVVTELGAPEIKVKWQYGDYTMLFTKCYETESSLAYHSTDEIKEYWSFMMDRRLHPYEIEGIKSRIVFECDHMWLKDTARVGMYWWERNT